MLFTDKYAPRGLDEVKGNEEALQEIKKWALDFERGKFHKPLLLHGPPGVGKTAIAKAVAIEFQWALIESNASDLRKPENLKKLLGANSKGLYNEYRLILLDEIDGAFDRGEFPELVKIIKENSQPMILTANDMWNPHLASVRQLCKAIELKKVNARSIAELLAKIANAEKLEAKKETLQETAKNCNGDVRSAIIDLQSGENGERERSENVFEAIRTVLKTKEYDKAINASDNLDMDLDTFIKWIEQNIPAEYEKPEEKATAFKWLAKSALMQGRIRRNQYWGLLRYVKAYSHAGVSLSKEETYRKFTPYSYPDVIRALGATKKSRAAFKTLTEKIGKKIHCSKKKVGENLGYFAFMPVEQWINLNEEEATVLKSFSSVGNQLKPNKKKKRNNK